VGHGRKKFKIWNSKFKKDREGAEGRRINDKREMINEGIRKSGRRVGLESATGVIGVGSNALEGVGGV
jgi:hypothetical protein